jgi:hypothetical protein
MGLQKHLLWLCGFFLMAAMAHAQDPQADPQDRHIGGALTVTNNGISLLPTFSLGKPAAIFDLTVGGEKLSFDPQFRFAWMASPGP